MAAAKAQGKKNPCAKQGSCITLHTFQKVQINGIGFKYAREEFSSRYESPFFIDEQYRSSKGRRLTPQSSGFLTYLIPLKGFLSAQIGQTNLCFLP
jgi:hypothetical protein